MQIIKSLFKLLVFICPFVASGQSTFLPQGDKGATLVERLEIKQQRNTNLNFSTLRPFNRRYIVKQAEFLDSARMGFKDPATGEDKFKEFSGLHLSSIDEYNLKSLLMNNSEWVSGPKEGFASRKPVLKSLYTTKPNLLEVNAKDFFLALNPILQFNQSMEVGNSQRIFLNTRGITARGMISKKIGFSTTITDNQERGPLFYQKYVNGDSGLIVPGVGFAKRFKTTGVDYFDARGYITFNVAKYVDVQFGYDKNFIGNGYRSLFLSDWGNSYLFLKLNTKIWKFNYQNLFMELMPQFGKNNGDVLIDRKYAAMHHLSMNISKSVNIGLFEGIVFGRRNRFDFQYLNPIIFFRHVEGTVGSPDNALAGIDFKANALHHLQFYGQFLLDEFVLKQIKDGNGWWANKWGFQLGVKYVDAFNVPNLDLQFETNRVRPFTYSHYTTISNYSHYNQPLAHPLGANFQEYIGIIKYQPAPRWYINARAIYFKQGLDSANGRNYGANILKSNYEVGNGGTRKGDYGYSVGSGRKVNCINGWLNVSYELRENLYFDASIQFRNYKIANEVGPKNMTMLTAGVRLNIAQRAYDF